MAPHQIRSIQRWRIREAVMIPMIAEDRVVGGLNLNRLEGSAPLSADDIKLLETLATRAGRAIAIAQLMRDQKLTAGRLETTAAQRAEELGAANHFLDSMIEDIPETRKAQEAVRKAQEEAERANRAKSEFLASMSHELRTPLNAILGFSELLSDDSTDQFDKKTRRRFLDQIHSSGQHLLQLINDILDLSKVEAGQMELHLESVELGSVIQDVRATTEPLALSKSITLNTELKREISLIADSPKVKQMLLNLVSNAIKFTPTAGRIDICISLVESRGEIAVSDSGIGIAKEALGRLVTELQQLDARPRRQQA